MVPQCYSSGADGLREWRGQVRSKMKRITSRQNPIVARYRAVARGDVPDLLVLDGAHLVCEALESGVAVRQLVVRADAAGRQDVRDVMARAAADRVEILTATAAVVDAISPVRSSSALVALADRPVANKAALFDGQPLVIIAADVQDPGNVGAIVRVAAAAGATGVIVAGASADPFGWKALRGSTGSALRFPVVIEKETGRAVAEARQRGCRILATVPRDGESVFDVDLRGSAAILIGGEGSGLAPTLLDGSDERVTIPMRVPVESLNAAVATAIIVYEASRQRKQI